MVAKYHLHTNLVIDTTTTKHHSHNLGHPYYSAKDHCNISLATNTIVTNYLSFLPRFPSHCVYPIHTKVCNIYSKVIMANLMPINVRYCIHPNNNIINSIHNYARKVLIFVQISS